MSMKKIALLIVLIAGLTFLVAGCGNGAKAGPPAGPEAFPVKVITAQAQMVPLSTDYLATLKSRNAPTLQPCGGRRRDQDLCEFRPAGRARSADSGDRPAETAGHGQQSGSHRPSPSRRCCSRRRLTWNARRNFPRPGVISRAELDQAQNVYGAAKADAEALQAALESRKCSCITTPCARRRRA